MADVIVIINQKGGAGKTTTAINLAAGYAFIGSKVLAIDLDPQGHLSKYTNCLRDGKKMVHDLLKGVASFEETVQKVSFGEILPADSTLSEYLMNLTLKPSALFLLQKALKPILTKYDYIIVDCPPAINQLTIAAMVAADRLILPTEAEFFSVDGLTQLISQTVQEIQEHFNPNLKIEGILLVKYKSNLKETQKMTAILEQLARDYFGTKVFETRIRDNVAVPASQSARKSIFEYDSKCHACQDYLSLIKELAGQVEGEKPCI